MITWNVTFDENSFISAGINLDSTNLNRSQNGASLRDLLTKDVRSAGEEWSKHLADPSNGSSIVDVQVVSDPSTDLLGRPTQGTLSNAGDSLLTTATTSKSSQSYPVPQLRESNVAHKIITGSDPNGSSPDLVININPNYLKNNVWLDRATFPSGTADQADAVSAFAHEIGHALAFDGFRNPVAVPVVDVALNPGLLVLPIESTFDDNVVLELGSAFFDGPNVRSVYGDRAPLFYHLGNTQNIYHLAGDSAPILSNDLLNGSKFHPSYQYDVSALDLAILADCGFNLNGPLNLIQNGSFESGSNPGSYLTLSPGSTAIPGWTVIRGGIDYYGTGWVASDGNRSLDLNGTPGVGGVAQTFATISGQTYQVSFDMAGHPSGLLQTMEVSAAGQSKDFTFQAGTDSNHLGWQGETWSFTANAPQTTLELYSLQTGYPYGGPALDNVKVEISSPTLLASNSAPVNSSSSPTPPTTGSNPSTTTIPGPVYILGGSNNQVQGPGALGLPWFEGSSGSPPGSVTPGDLTAGLVGQLDVAKDLIPGWVETVPSDAARGWGAATDQAPARFAMPGYFDTARTSLPVTIQGDT